VGLLQQLQSDLKDKRLRVVWLQGSLGQGKTAIALSLRSQLYPKNPVVSLPFDNKGMMIFARAIAGQLARLSHEFGDALIGVLRETPELFMDRGEQQTKELVIRLAELAAKISSSPRVVIVVDGLERCRDLQMPVDLVRELLQLPRRFVVFISSRHIEPVRRFFFEEVPVQNRSLHILDSVDSRDDLRKFVQVEHSRSIGLVGRPLEVDTVNKIVDRCGGSFEIASDLTHTVLRLLRLCKQREVDNILEYFSSSACARVYKRIMESACTNSSAETRNRSIQALITVFEPMTLSSLGDLLGEDVGQVESVLQPLSEVLVVDENTQWELCTGFRQFLLSDRGPIQFDGPQHKAIFEDCLTKFRTSDYGRRMWGKHLKKSGSDDAESVLVGLREFVDDHLIEWLDSIRSDDAHSQCIPPCNPHLVSALFMPFHRSAQGCSGVV